MEAQQQVTKQGFAEAERLLNKAIELDPDMARAYILLVYIYNYVIDLGMASPEETLPKERAAAQRAVTLDPSDGETHLAMGTAHAYRREPDAALVELTIAEQMAPNNADMLLVIAWFLPAFGESEKAVRRADRAVLLNPHYPEWYKQALVNVYFFGKQFEKSVRYSQLMRNPLGLDKAYEAMALAYLGDQDEASKAASQALKLEPGWDAEQYLSNMGFYADAPAELLIEGARRAGLPACVDRATAKQPNFVRIKSCDAERAKAASG